MKLKVDEIVATLFIFLASGIYIFLSLVVFRMGEDIKYLHGRIQEMSVETVKARREAGEAMEKYEDLRDEFTSFRSMLVDDGK